MAESSTPASIARSLFPEIWASTSGPLVPQIATPVPITQSPATIAGNSSATHPPRPTSPVPTTSRGSSSGANADDLSEWLTSQGVDECNVETLKSNGFTTLPTLALLKPQDILDIGVTPLGQIRLLEHIISPPVPTQKNASTPTIGPVESVAQLLQPNIQQAGTEASLSPTAVDCPETAARFSRPLPSSTQYTLTRQVPLDIPYEVFCDMETT